MLDYITLIISILFTPLFFAVRNHPNGVAGIRVSYTLDYPDIWKRVHTLTGGINAVFNVIALSSLFTATGFLRTAIIWFCFLFPTASGCVYTFILGSKRTKEEHIREENERRQAEKKETDIRIQRHL